MRRAAYMLLGLAACSQAPENPTWVDDVQPILMANCVRCHGRPALGGTPTTFRLDVYDDVVIDPTTAPRREVRGAATMAPFIRARALAGDMPPAGPTLSKVQREILDRWGDVDPAAGDVPEQGIRQPNSIPNAALEGAFTVAADQSVTLIVTVSDADDEQVVGELSTPAVGVISRDLSVGRNEIVWDTSSVPPGTHPLLYDASDGVDTNIVSPGEVTVTHANGNTAPRVTILSPHADDLVADSEPDLVVRFQLDDPDANTFTATAELFHGTVVVPITASMTVTVGETMLTLPATSIPAAPNWRVRVSVSDGTATTTAVSGYFIVLHPEATQPTYDNQIKPVLDTFCVRCHTGLLDFPSFRTYNEAVLVRGRMYRRVVQKREMPPKSAEIIFPNDPVFGDAERDLIRAWLAAGAPEL